jgi:hypothetical protein
MLWIEFILFIGLIVVLIVFFCNINKIFSKLNKKNLPNISRYLIVLILIISLIGIIEYWVHFQDENKILKNKFALPYLIGSFLPLENTINLNNIEFKLPYGYKLVDDYSAIGIINSVELYDNMNKRFGSSEQLGSTRSWFYNDKRISFYKIQRGGINYLIMYLD